MERSAESTPLKQVGRYTIFDQIGAGGMATVHLARFVGPAGFSRTVAVKHLHPHLAADDEFRTMIIDEARIASRVRHPNVVPTLDVVVEDGEVYIVMEFIQGEALSFLRREAKRVGKHIPASICSAIMVGALQGLHAAHEARSESGALLNLVHRDVSPPNILVGADGMSLVLDFGVAKALQSHAETKSGRLKGKSSYMAPEQIRGERLTRSADIFAASVVLWEILTGRRLYYGATEQERMYKVLQATDTVPPSLIVPGLPSSLDDIVMKGLRHRPEERFQTALEMAEAIEAAVRPASQRAVADWVAHTATESLRHRDEVLKHVEISQLAVPIPATETTRTSAGSQLSYGPIAIPVPRRRPSWRSPRAILEGVAVGAAAIGVLVLVARAGRLSEAPIALPPAPATIASHAERIAASAGVSAVPVFGSGQPVSPEAARAQLLAREAAIAEAAAPGADGPAREAAADAREKVASSGTTKPRDAKSPARKHAPRGAGSRGDGSSSEGNETAIAARPAEESGEPEAPAAAAAGDR